MKALIKFGAFGQYTILVPIDTLGCVDGVLVRGFGYTELEAIEATRNVIVMPE